MKRSIFASRSFAGALALTLWACSSNEPGNPPADASTDTIAVVDGANDTAPPADAGDAQADASDAADSSDSGNPQPDAGDAGDSGATLTPQRVDDIRVCMDARWGASPTRAAIDVADDFDQCTTPAENTGAVGDANFALVLDGWAEPDPSDHSLMRKIVRDH